jgi:hypothetical protein
MSLLVLEEAAHRAADDNLLCDLSAHAGPCMLFLCCDPYLHSAVAPHHLPNCAVA